LSSLDSFLIEYYNVLQHSKLLFGGDVVGVQHNPRRQEAIHRLQEPGERPGEAHRGAGDAGDRNGTSIRTPPLFYSINVAPVQRKVAGPEVEPLFISRKITALSRLFSRKSPVKQANLLRNAYGAEDGI